MPPRKEKEEEKEGLVGRNDHVWRKTVVVSFLFVAEAGNASKDGGKPSAPASLSFFLPSFFPFSSHHLLSLPPSSSLPSRKIRKVAIP